jgi:two-component sensor histidine kinase
VSAWIENLLLRIPTRQYGRVARYAITALIVLVFFAIRLGLPLSGAPFLLFIPPVFLASLLFDRGSGFLATALSTPLAVYFFIGPDAGFVAANALMPTLLYIAICVTIAAMTEALRQAVERARAAEQGKDVLFRELSHRAKNDFSTITSMLHLQARAQSEPAAQEALQDAVRRVNVITSAYAQLTPDERKGLLPIRDYLGELTRTLGDALRGLRPIAIRFRGDAIDVPAEDAIRVGLIVNELATNAFKYAFPDQRDGTVDVSLYDRGGGELEIEVTDDGVGFGADAKDGLGSKLVRLLVQQLGGTMSRDRLDPGCRVVCRLKVSPYRCAGPTAK